jgi:hypothetical protein
MPFRVCTSESWMSMTYYKTCPITQSKSTELSAKFPFMLEIFECSFSFFVWELLVWVFLNPLLKVAWNCWEVVESWLVDSVFVLTSDDKLCSFLTRCYWMEIHASTRLHWSSYWLFNLLGNVWHMIAINYLEIEFNIRMERNWLTPTGAHVKAPP